MIRAIYIQVVILAYHQLYNKIIMDGQSPLAVQFKEFDTDGDNKLTPDQVYELLKLLGKNIYKGSVTSALKMLNYADQDPQNSLFTFPQFKQFLQSLQNPLKHDIWKGKYKLLSLIKEVRDAVKIKEAADTAAPGAKPVSTQSPFRGDIEITVGPVNQAYDSFIHAVVQKTPKAESKPFIKIVFDQGSNQKAKQMEQRFKALQTSLFDLMKSSDPESAEILDYIHIITNVADAKLNIFVTTSNEALIELGIITADFVDQVLGNKLEAKVEFKHEFCIDINKFIDKSSDYSFYHALTKNYHTKLVWNAINFKESTKQIFKILDLFKDLKYDKMEPFSLLLIGILHTELCEANFVFDNAELSATELESKAEILVELGQLYGKVKEQNGDLGIIETIACFNNKFYLEASIGDWKAKVNVEIKDFKELFSTKIAPQEKEEDESYNQPIEVKVQAKEMGDKLSQKSMKSVKSKSELSEQSQSSMKKPHKGKTKLVVETKKEAQSDSESS